MATSTRTARRPARPKGKRRAAKPAKSTAPSKSARKRATRKAIAPARKKAANKAAKPARKPLVTQSAKPVRKHAARKSAGPAKTATAPRRAVPVAGVSRGHELILAPPSSLGPRWTEKLRDGTHVMIRPIRKGDAELERRFIERLSDETRRFRFLGVIKTPSAALLKQLTDIDYQHDMAFVALVHDEGEKREVGVSRFSVAPDGQASECAVVVADNWQGRGLGTLLMRHLIEVARSRGIRRMISIDASENMRMRDLAHFLGFHSRRDPQDAHQIVYTLDL